MEASTVASIIDPAPDVPVEPLLTPEEDTPAEVPDDDADPELPEEGPLLLLLLHAAQRTVAAIDRLRALDMVTLREKARRCVPTERGRRIE